MYTIRHCIKPKGVISCMTGTDSEAEGLQDGSAGMVQDKVFGK